MGLSQDSKIYEERLSNGAELEIKQVSSNKEFGSVSINSRFIGYIEWQEHEAFATKIAAAYDYFVVG